MPTIQSKTPDPLAPSGEGISYLSHQSVILPGDSYAGFADLGYALSDAREARGLTREDVANTLKLSVKTIGMLEEGALMDMPHAVYAKGFLRAYATLMKIPPESYSALLASLTPQQRVQAPVRPRARRSGRRSPIPGIVASLLVASAIGFCVWHFGLLDLLVSEGGGQPQTTAPMQSSEPPAQAAPAAPAAPAAQGAAAQAASGEAREPLAAVVEPESPWSSLQGNATLAGQAGLAGAEAQSANPNAPASADALPTKGAHTVKVTAVARCWTQATADSGRPAQRTLEVGETLTVSFEKSLSLRVGSISGVRVYYDGKEVTEKGKRGQAKTYTFPPAR